MGLFKSKEERRIERDMKIRQGIRRIEKAIAEQNKFQDEFVKNARQAKAIGDQSSYQFIRNSLKKTATIKKLLERQHLAVKNALLIKRQAEAAADFGEAMKLMASEVSRLYGDADLTKTQMDWEKAIAQSQSMEERMEMFLESIESSAAQDLSLSSKEAITDDEIDRLIAAEEQVEQARDSAQMSALRAELADLKGEAQKEGK
ncbi:MAG: hypothetical protein KDA32_01385 [Phycisphaerales bacterium]|nr:hypothetical protein [Phycisphaerales bacterium]